MSLESQASEALPSRRRRAPRGGRHRGAESFALPPDAPSLVLAVPGPAAGFRRAAAELAQLTETQHTGQPVRVGHLVGREAMLTNVVNETIVADKDRRAADMPAAVVVPLLTGPHPAVTEALQAAVAGAVEPVLVAAPLGPHPLIAQALHDRLAEASLARPDRVRMVTMVTAAGGVIVLTSGGPDAARDAEVTSVLLASRLAVPVGYASLDGGPGVAATADGLRRAGAERLAIAPCLIGPEVDPAQVTAAAAEARAAHAAPLGAHPALAHLIALRYVEALESALTGRPPSNPF